MSEKISKIIKEVNADLNDDTRHFQQDFVAFRPKEFQAVREAEKTITEKLFTVGKGRAIALACRTLTKLLEDNKETKADEKA
ncbi:MAG: hypothetical protein PHP25_01305 [Candidatus Moranbacteria bacterium]|nr:hypothetical protein [Candidatus Moranbacteria bacterium]